MIGTMVCGCWVTMGLVIALSLALAFILVVK